MDKVVCYEKSIVLPTYILDEDEKCPIFEFFIPCPRYHTVNRPIYPYSLQNLFTGKRVDMKYKGLFLENKYIKLLILPDCRGRLQGALDKLNGWDFIYWNHVIKPALVSSRGAWLSGGIEWNHPGGHGYTTLNKISYVTLNNPDGSKSIVIGELEPVRSYKWIIKVTLYPEKSYVETEVRLINPFSTPIPFYCSLNGAFHATDETEIIYPPSYVTGHGVRKINEWSIINGIDYRFLKNILHSVSFFSINQKGGFFGCYHHDKKSGTVIFGNPFTVPGQKFFTWGKDPMGRMWGKIISDEDGEVFELQAGVFWHNIGYGYAWLEPYELKQAKVYWYPVREIGGFKKANKEAAVNLEVHDDKKIKIGIITTSPQPASKLILKEGKKTLFETLIDLMPEKPYIKKIPIMPETNVNDLTLTLYSSGGTELISYTTQQSKIEKVKPASLHKPFRDLTVDELYIRAMTQGKGTYPDLFLMQPWSKRTETAFKEILKKDPGDSRANRMLGMMYYKRGLLDDAEKYLKAALERDDLLGGYEAHYYLGLVKLEKGQIDESEEEFWRASNKLEYRSPSYCLLAEIAIIKRHFDKALSLIEESFMTNANNIKAHELKIVALRKIGHLDDAKKEIEKIKTIDPLDFIAWSESYFINRDDVSRNQLNELLYRDDKTFIGVQYYLDIAISYLNWGFLDEAIDLLQMAKKQAKRKFGQVYPLIEYYLAYLFNQKGDINKALEHLRLGSEAKPDYCFPYRKETEKVLRYAIIKNPKDAKACYYLGNLLWYLNRHKEAIKFWEKSAQLDSKYPMVHRNLGNAYATLQKDIKKAKNALEKALMLDPNDPRIMFELTELYEQTRESEKSLEILEKYPSTVSKLDDLVLRQSVLYLRKGEYEKALKMIETHQFTGREVGQGSHTIFAEILLRQAEELLEKGEYFEALKKIKKSLTYPENLRQAEHYCRDFCRENYLLGCVYEGLGEHNKATKYWEKTIIDDASKGTISQFYRAMALRKMAREKESRSILLDLMSRAQAQIEEGKEVELIDETGTIEKTSKKRLAHGHYLLSLVYKMLDKPSESEKELKKALEFDPDVALNAYVTALRSIKRFGYRRPWDRAKD